MIIKALIWNIFVVIFRQTLTNSIQPTNGEKQEGKDGKEINV